MPDSASDAPKATRPRSVDTPDTRLRVRVSGEYSDSPPEFRMLVDGRQVGGIYTVTANYRKAEWQTIELRACCGPRGPIRVEIEYINDVSSDSCKTDRNLLVDRLEVDGSCFLPQDADYDRNWLEEIRGQQRMAWGGRLVFHIRRARGAGEGWTDYSARRVADALSRGPSALVPDWTTRPATKSESADPVTS